jgi:hypothetical protein
VNRRRLMTTTTLPPLPRKVCDRQTIPMPDDEQKYWVITLWCIREECAHWRKKKWYRKEECNRGA